ncbi:hypothetical protein RRF57_013318 [Xylaria bambusicola]|uniref:J domain-containing protein n=1 Tax=Xylaria bambusicola TaxID=326684 RepID=A0AAN7UXY1_9PEZI
MGYHRKDIHGNSHTEREAGILPSFVLHDDSDNETDVPSVTAANTGYQAQRNRINHVLKLIQRHASLYELLDINIDAKKLEIIKAWKKIVAGIHPDKNEDKAAKQCTQAVNEAKELLSDPKRRKLYDDYLEKNPPPPKVETFDEDFDDGAFDYTGNDDTPSQDDEDDEANDEVNYPPASQNIMRYHAKVTPVIEEFFATLEGEIDYSLLDQIEPINELIAAENQVHNIFPTDMYKIPRIMLLGFQFHQRHILMGYKTQLYDTLRVQKEAQELKKQFAKACRRKLYQWPCDWVDLCILPLNFGLESRGFIWEQQISAPLISNDEDIEMEDIDKNVDDDDEGGLGRQITAKRRHPAFTASGAPILGYIPHYRRVNGLPIAFNFTIFIKVDNNNPIKIARRSEVSMLEARAYHDLPKHERNNVQDSAVKYATMDPTDTVDIIGIAWVPASAGSDRMPPTYIWVKTPVYSDKAAIMTKTTFRKWLGQRVADGYIESWFASKGISPQWKAPYPESGRLLTYPTVGRPSCTSTTAAKEATEEDGRIEKLTKQFERIVDMLAKGQEEAREDRKQYQEFLQRYVYPPNSGH